MDDERRQFTRVPLTADAPVIYLQVELSVGEQTAQAQVINIAEEGLFLATKAPIERSVRVEIDFVVQDEACPATGTVVWKTNRGIGIRLTEPSAAFRRFVQRLAEADLDERWELLKHVSKAQIRAV